MTRAAHAVLAATAVVVGAACGGGSSSGPPDIEYGRDVCDECHMIISEARFAAAYRTADDDERIFDEIGDMLAHGIRTDELDAADAWVHDHDTEEWVDAPAAVYVRSEVETPMGSGVVAFAEDADAEAYAAEHGGELLEWTALVELATAGSLDARSRGGNTDG